MAHKTLWHDMINIGAINSKHTKTYGVTKNHGLPCKFVTLLLNGMPCHHHMEDQIVINRKGQQYFQLANK
jgi:hypothetical protein